MNTLPQTDLIAPERPRLRGVLHQVGFAAACFVGIAFLSTLEGRRLAAAAVFAAAAAAMLGASTLYHRITWSPSVRPWMRRIDHAGVYLLIAATYTPVGLLSLHGTLPRIVRPSSGVALPPRT